MIRSLLSLCVLLWPWVSLAAPTSQPAAPAASRPVAQPTTRQPTTRPTSKPAAPAASRPVAPASSRPVAQPTTRPTSRPAPRKVRPFRWKRLSASPFSVGLDPRVVDSWVKAAKDNRSDALVLVKDGLLVGQWYFGKERGLIPLMSVTKSIVSLAVGALLDEGKIKSLDAPVHKFYPQWNKGWHAKVTVRHLLAHTSGLKARRTTEKIYASGDFIKYALKGPITTRPGDTFRYNNRAYNLLSGIIQKASGKRMDRYIAEKLFKPLGIKKYHWKLDKAGHPPAMSGLSLAALDLARIGVMLMRGGRFSGKQVLSKRWIQRSTRPQPHRRRRWGRHPHGFAWWLRRPPFRESIDAAVLKTWREAGLPQRIAQKLKPMIGKVYVTPPGAYFRIRRRFYADLRRTLGRDYWGFRRFLRAHRLKRATRVYGRQPGFYGDGFLGQYLVVLPHKKLVAVRQRRWSRERKRAYILKRFPQEFGRNLLVSGSRDAKGIAALDRLYALGKKAASLPQAALAKGLAYALAQSASKDPLTRDLAYWVLGQMGPKAARQEAKLRQRFATEASLVVKARILWALGQIGQKASRPLCQKLLLDAKSPWKLRFAAAGALGAIGGRELQSAKQTLGLFERKLPWVLRIEIAKGLATGAASSRLLGHLLRQIQLLTTSRNRAKSFLRRMYSQVVVRIQMTDSARTEVCMLFLRDRDWSLQRAGRRCLYDMGPRASRALPILKALVKYMRPGYRRRYLMRLIRRIQGPQKASTPKASTPKARAKPTPRRR